MKKETMRYSEAFKLQIVSELESGKLTCPNEARRRYGIKGSCTIENWIRKYGKTHLLNKVVRVETPKERDRLKEIEEENRRLKSALADAHLDLRLEKAYVEIACEVAGIDDVNSFKKKAGITPCTKHRKKGKK